MFDFNAFFSYTLIARHLNVAFFAGSFALALITCIYVLAPVGVNARKKTNLPSVFISILLIIALSVLMALFPFEENTWSDREGYFYMFKNIHQVTMGDVGWYAINQLIHRMTVIDQFYFFGTVALLFTGFRYAACYMFNKRYSFILFVMTVTSFLFWSYATNTIRAGVASSILLFAFSLYPFGKRGIICFLSIGLCSISIHQSMILPLTAFLISIFFRKHNVVLILWIFAFFISLAFGSFFENILGQFVLENAGEQAGEYILNAHEATYNVGFRFDFILYSVIPIAIGWYYMEQKGFKDKLYDIMYCAYVLSNIFFLLVIRASFVDRFAYLSWFMMPIILMYPLLQKRMFVHQNRVIALTLFLNAAFTMFMFLYK